MLTEKTKENYLQEPNNCPICKSEDITGGEVEFTDTSSYREVTCNECSAKWNDVYDLVSIELLEENIIDEDADITYYSETQFSYEEIEENGEYVRLFKDDACIGRIYVWLDSEMDDREYITISHTIIYLDTLTEKESN